MRKIDRHLTTKYRNKRCAKRVHHDDVIKWKHYTRFSPFPWAIHRSPVNSPHKNQWRGILNFSSICAWIIGWVNNREAGDVRRHRAYYDVIVMIMRTSTVRRIIVKCSEGKTYLSFNETTCLGEYFGSCPLITLVQRHSVPVNIDIWNGIEHEREVTRYDFGLRREISSSV